ncbi:copper resistance protein CopC [Microbacterium insulae]|uniref:Copper resistance protein CopC n=1 Tax=Microbacterium insulae TaxID=483014 RepID=A0ABW3ALJ7_9MICO
MSTWQHRIVATTAVLVAATGLVFATAIPAAAHENIASSSPTGNERFDTAPTSAELVFTGDVLTIGAAVAVVDESGKNWVTGGPQIDNATVVVELAPGMPDAGYQLRWRVVSGDGHVISSIIPFTIGDGEPYSRENEATASPPTESEASKTDASAQGAPEFWQLALVGLAGAVFALGLYLAIRFTRRRTQTAPLTSDDAADIDSKGNPHS